MRYAVLFVVTVLTISTSYSQWNRVEALPVTDVGSLFIDAGVFLAGTDSAVYISMDAGEQWTRTVTLPGSPTLIDAVLYYGGVIYAGTGGNGVFVSHNLGESWQPFSNGLNGLGSGFISDFAVWQGVVHAATMGAGVFALHQNMWQPVGNLAGNTAGNVNFLAVKGDTLVAGAGGNGNIYYLLSGTISWSEVNIAPILTEPFVVTSAVSFLGSYYAGGTYSVYRSTTDGATWEFSGNGLPGGRIVRLMPYGNQLYASASSVSTSFYRSSDGEDWTLIETTTGAYTTRITGDKLYAARFDGLWYRSLVQTPVDDPFNSPAALALGQNYPNPFNPTTRIAFELRSSMSVSLKVFDMLGRNVATLVEGLKPAGFHQVEFNATGLTSGVYYCRLEAHGFAQTRKMILIQ